ncbi:MAG: hypothetical protein WDM90_05085 [Ferruginibacter sp.]
MFRAPFKLLFYYWIKDNDAYKGYLLDLQAIAIARQYNFVVTEIDLMLELSTKLNNKLLGNKADSAKLLLEQSLNMSVRYKLIEQQINALTGKGTYYAASKPDSAKKYYLQALAITRQSNLPKVEVVLLRTMALTYSINHWGDSSNSLMHDAISVARAAHLVDLEIGMLRRRISSESGFFVKDSFITSYERLLLLSRQNKRDSLGFMATFAQSCADIGNYPKALQVFFILLHTNEEKQDIATALSKTVYAELINDKGTILQKK